jgi:hypothetical protein
VLPEQSAHDTVAPHRLIRLYEELGRDVVSHTGADGALAAVARIAATAVPGAEYASITRGFGGGHFRTLASTHAAALHADRLQYELQSGPCVEAAVEDGVVLSEELDRDSRWPVFSARVVQETDIRSVLSVRMVLDEDDAVAALNVYSIGVGAFTPDSRTLAILLAIHGSVAVCRLITQERATNLERALRTNREIGMAMGVLMSSHKLSRDEAFDALRIASQSTGRKLHDVATDVVDSGALQLPAPPRPRPGT